MEIRWVKNIQWSGTELSTYALLLDCGMSTMSIVPAPSLFLLSQAQSGRDEDTLRAAAQDLKSLFGYLANINKDWRCLSDGEMTGYIHFQLIGAKDLKGISIDRHISSLKGFYDFGWESGMLSGPVDFSYSYKKNETEQNKESARRVNFNLKNQYLNRILFDQVLCGINAESDYIVERNELTLHLGIEGGLRTSEVTDERNLQTPDLRLLIEKADKVGQNTITVKIYGKGSKLRHVDFPPKLTRKIRYFLEGRRKDIKDGALICSVLGKNLRCSHATDVFRKAKYSIQYRIPFLLENLSAEELKQHYVSFEAFKDLTFHCLRHTYATNLVDFCYRHGFNPEEYVPEQMGHEDEATTREYLVFDGMINRREKVRRALEDE